MQSYPRAAGELEPAATGQSGRIIGWQSALSRAAGASAGLAPGLLTDAVDRSSKRAAYVGSVGVLQPEAAVAADRAGHISELSLGDEGTLAARITNVWQRSDLVVSRLPVGSGADAIVADLLAARRPQDSVLVVAVSGGPQLELAPALAVGPGYRGLLSSQSTRQSGLIAATDLSEQILARLQAGIPRQVQGRPIYSTAGGLDELRSLASRLAIVRQRRVPLLVTALGLWAVLLGAMALARRRAGVRCALRLLFLGALWVPVLCLATAAVAPPRTIEVGVIGLGALALAAATDYLLPWPRGPVLPAVAGLGAHLLVLTSGSQLLAKSISGPDPEAGARFFGIGNELAVVVMTTALIAAAAATTTRRWPLQPRLALAAATVIAAGLLGAGSLGANVGSAATAVVGGAFALLAAPPRRRGLGRVALAVASPLLAVTALAIFDLATSAGAHLTRSVLEGQGPSNLVQIALRKWEAALNLLTVTPLAIASGVVVVAAIAGVWQRKRVLRTLAYLGPSERQAFEAGIVGAFVAAVAASFLNDSGPEMTVIGLVMLALAITYVRGRPEAPAQMAQPPEAVASAAG